MNNKRDSIILTYLRLSIVRMMHRMRIEALELFRREENHALVSANLWVEILLLVIVAWSHVTCTSQQCIDQNTVWPATYAQVSALTMTKLPYNFSQLLSPSDVQTGEVPPVKIITTKRCNRPDSRHQPIVSTTRLTLKQRNKRWCHYVIVSYSGWRGTAHLAAVKADESTDTAASHQWASPCVTSRKISLSMRTPLDFTDVKTFSTPAQVDLSCFVFARMCYGWVSSFLTAHQHIFGYLVPYNDEDTTKERELEAILNMN